MSILIEIAGSIAGALLEHAHHRQWGLMKTFTISFIVFFSMGRIASLFYTSNAGILMEVFCAAILGGFMGLAFLVPSLATKYKEKRQNQP